MAARCALFLALLLAARAAVTPSPTQSPSPTQTPSLSSTLSLTSSPTPTITASPSHTASITPTPSETPSHTPSPTPTPSVTASRTASLTPSVTSSVTPSATPSGTPSVTPSVTSSVTPSSTPTRSPTVTPTGTRSGTSSPTPTQTATHTSTNSLPGCPAGFYREGRSPACTPCREGSFGATDSSNSSAVCKPCGAGFKCNATGLAAAVPCEAGSSAPEGATACAPCPLRFFSSRAGSLCSPCPAGAITLGVGSTACFSLAATCSANQQPRAPGLAATLNPATDCVPLACEPRWQPSAGNVSCAAACLPFLPAPLPPNTSALERALAPGASAACSAATLLPAAPPNPLTPPAAASLLQSAPFVIAQAVGGAGALLVLLYCAVVRTRARRLVRLFRCCDMLFAVPTAYPARGAGAAAPAAAAAAAPPAAAGSEVQGRPTALGGLFSFLFFLTFIGLVLWSLISFVYGNTSVTVAPDQLLQGRAAQFASLPWAAPRGPAAAALLPPLPPLASLQLRLLGSRALGCGALAPAFPLRAGAPAPPQASAAANATSLAALPGEAGMWQVSSAACAPASADASGAPLDTSLLLLSCVACELTAASYVTFALDFTCQALHLEAVAVDANGDVNVVAFPANDQLLAGAANASSGGPGYLAAVSWTLAPTLTTVQDGVNAGGGSLTARGYRLVTSASALTLTSPALDNAGGGVLPLANSVVVTVALPLQALYYTSTLAPRTSLQELVSGVFGLLGAIGVFGALFQVSKRCRRTGVGTCLLGSPNSGSASGPGSGIASSTGRSDGGSSGSGDSVAVGGGGSRRPGGVLSSVAGLEEGGSAGARPAAQGWPSVSLPAPADLPVQWNPNVAREAFQRREAEEAAARAAVAAAAAGAVESDPRIYPTVRVEEAPLDASDSADDTGAAPAAATAASAAAAAPPILGRAGRLLPARAPRPAPTPAPPPPEPQPAALLAEMQAVLARLELASAASTARPAGAQPVPAASIFVSPTRLQGVVDASAAAMRPASPAPPLSALQGWVPPGSRAAAPPSPGSVASRDPWR